MVRRCLSILLSIGVVGSVGPEGSSRPEGAGLGVRETLPLQSASTAPLPSVGNDIGDPPLEKRFPFSAGGDIRVENPRGRILVFEGAPQQVRVLARGSKTPVSEADLRIELKKTTAVIKCVAHQQQRVIDLHLAVPAGVKLKLTAEEGTIQVHGRVAGVRAETLSGDVILGIPVEDVRVQITWLEGYIRYGGPPLERATAPTLLSLPPRGAAPPPALLVGKLGSGRVPVDVRTLNGWVELGTPTSSPQRTIIGAVSPQPLSLAARTIASNPRSPLGVAVRSIEPRLERALAQADWLAAPTGPMGNPADQEVVTLESPLVTLNVSVTDGEGKVITGLTAADFTVEEDGVPQTITHFTTETAPFNLVLLLDVSGSTRGNFDLIRQAARRFVALLRPEDRLAIILFARDVQVVAHLTNDREALERALSRVEPPLGSTAVYDAIGYALIEEMGRVRGQRNALVVLSDGRDSSTAYLDTPLAHDPLRRPGSFLRFEDLLAGVAQSDALLYPILLENEGQLAATLIASAREQVREGTRLAQEQFRQLADVSGGRMYRAAKLEDLDGVYDQIVADLRTIYSLAYMPTRAERDGRWRRVDVTVSRLGARVRTRRGYFAQ